MISSYASIWVNNCLAQQNSFEKNLIMDHRYGRAQNGWLQKVKVTFCFELKKQDIFPKLILKDSTDLAS